MKRKKHNYSLFIETDNENLTQDIVNQLHSYEESEVYAGVFDTVYEDGIYYITVNNSNPFILICTGLIIKSAIVNLMSEINIFTMCLSKDVARHKKFNKYKIRRVNDILKNNELSIEQCKYYYKKYLNKAT